MVPYLFTSIAFIINFISIMLQYYRFVRYCLESRYMRCNDPRGNALGNRITRANPRLGSRPPGTRAGMISYSFPYHLNPPQPTSYSGSSKPRTVQVTGFRKRKDASAGICTSGEAAPCREHVTTARSLPFSTFRASRR